MGFKYIELTNAIYNQTKKNYLSNTCNHPLLKKYYTSKTSMNKILLYI